MAARVCGVSRRRLPGRIIPLSRALCTASSTYDYDVLVVGGGIAGAALACRLAGPDFLQGFRIGLVEARPPPPLESVMKRDAPDPRVYSFTPESVKLMKEVGVWDRVSSRTQPFRSMQVWDKHGHGFMRFDGDDVGGSELGHIVEHSSLQSSLFERLSELEGEGLLDLLCPGSVESAVFGAVKQGSAPDAPMEVTVGNSEGKQVLRTRLLVAADGGASVIRRLRGMPTWGWGYGQKALVATVRVQMHHDTAWQRFLPSGPLALLPLWGEYSSFVWSTTPAEADTLLALPEDEFLQQLNDALRSQVEESESTAQQPLLREAYFPPHHSMNAAHTGRVPPTLLSPQIRAASSVSRAVALLSSAHKPFEQPPAAIELCTRRFAFDLSLQQAKAYAGARIALVGDAAHTVHPMAGQGLNLGLADVSSLAGVLAEGKQSGVDLGSSHLLARYETDRKAKNLAMMGGLNALHHLFGSPSAAVAALRNIGIGSLNALGPIKARVAKYATGRM
ncbi:unnamed protein product [Chrysoparadoxa australica]